MIRILKEVRELERKFNTLFALHPISDVYYWAHISSTGGCFNDDYYSDCWLGIKKVLISDSTLTKGTIALSIAEIKFLLTLSEEQVINYLAYKLLFVH